MHLMLRCVQQDRAAEELEAMDDRLDLKLCRQMTCGSCPRHHVSAHHGRQVQISARIE